MEWPERRGGHAATCVSGPLLVIMGGAMSRETITSDCWIYDFTTMLWKKVLVSEIIMFVVCLKVEQHIFYLYIQLVVILYEW